MKNAVWLSGVAGSYAEAACVLQRVGQVALSATTVWRCVAKWGPYFQAVETAREEKTNALPVRGAAPETQVAEPVRLGAAMDGAMVHVRQEGWKELKVGCVFQIAPQTMTDPITQESVEQGHATQLTYVAHLGGPERLGRLLWSEAYTRGWAQTPDTQVIGDGAPWIWNLTAEFLAPRHQTVDWYHATQHLHQAAQRLYPTRPAQCVRWYNATETLLFQGHADTVATMLTKRATHLPDHADELLTQAAYFEHNQRRMQYLELREEGYLIGSGMIESAAKQFKARLAGPGMRWSRNGLAHLLPIRAAVLGHSFDDLWPTVYAFSKNSLPDRFLRRRQLC